MTHPNLKSARFWIAEIYLLLSVLAYWIMTGTLLNPIAFCLILTISAIAFWKNAIYASVIALLFLLLNLYMVLAMISELNEFREFNDKALQLLLFGSVYLGTNIAISIWMFVKWTSRLPMNNKDQQHSNAPY
jgi:hypothetical protein